MEKQEIIRLFKRIDKILLVQTISFVMISTIIWISLKGNIHTVKNARRDKDNYLQLKFREMEIRDSIYLIQLNKIGKRLDNFKK